MHIEDRFVASKAELIEERDRQSKQSLQRFLMITAHRHNTVSLTKQRLSQLTLHMTGRINASLQEPSAHNRIDRLRLSFDPGRTDAYKPC